MQRSIVAVDCTHWHTHTHTHTHTRAHLVGLIRTCDRPFPEICTWKQRTLTSDKTCPPPSGRIRTRNPNQRAAPNPRLLHRAATGIGPIKRTRYNFTNTNFFVARRRFSWPPSCHKQSLQVFWQWRTYVYDKYLRIPFSFTDACACFSV